MKNYKPKYARRNERNCEDSVGSKMKTYAAALLIPPLLWASINMNHFSGKKETPKLERMVQEQIVNPVKEVKNNYLKLDGNSKKYEAILNRYTGEIINAEFIARVITAESDWNPYEVSSTGAKGLMQLMPETAIEMGVRNVFNPEENIRGGVKYLFEIAGYLENNHPRWKGLPKKQKRELISAAYNGGPNRLKNRDWNIQKMPYETRNYVRKVTSGAMTF